MPKQRLSATEQLHLIRDGNATLMEERGRRLGIAHRMARCVSFGKLADFAATLKKGAHVQVECELRGREYDKDGVKHKVFKCRIESILKLDRAERRGENESDGLES
jgi:single-stranded DNA-binding protein